MSNDERIYCGVAKHRTVDFKGGGSMEVMDLLLFEKDIDVINGRWEAVQGGAFPAVKIAIKERKAVSPKGYTHYGEIDTWQPKQKDQPTDQPTEQQSPQDQGPTDGREELPF